MPMYTNKNKNHRYESVVIYLQDGQAREYETEGLELVYVENDYIYLNKSDGGRSIIRDWSSLEYKQNDLN